MTKSGMGMNFTQSVLMEVLHNGSVLQDRPGSTGDWISFDPLNGAWGTIAAENNQLAFILSRSPTLSNTIIQSQIGLLQSEGYLANMSNTYLIPNKNC